MLYITYIRRRNADTAEYTWDLPAEWQEQDAYDFYEREVDKFSLVFSMANYTRRPHLRIW